MVLAAGSLLVTHPAHNRYADSVIYITESSSRHTIGLELAPTESTTMSELMRQRDVMWPWTTTVSLGGESNRGALVMLHSAEWCSTNTMNITRSLSISSDALMVEKLEDGNNPLWFRLFIGCTVFDTRDLFQDTHSKNSRWLTLSNPPLQLVQRPSQQIWKKCVDEISSRATQQFFA